jgi:hypothetical protein
VVTLASPRSEFIYDPYLSASGKNQLLFCVLFYEFKEICLLQFVFALLIVLSQLAAVNLELCDKGGRIVLSEMSGQVIWVQESSNGVQCTDRYSGEVCKSKGKAVPLHAALALGVRAGIALTLS